MITSVPHCEYDNLATLNELLTALAHLGFENMSYGNDACPSIGKELGPDRYIQIYVDYNDPELRENEEMSEFGVVLNDDNTDERFDAHFDVFESTINCVLRLLKEEE